MLQLCKATLIRGEETYQPDRIGIFEAFLLLSMAFLTANASATLLSSGVLDNEELPDCSVLMLRACSPL